MALFASCVRGPRVHVSRRGECYGEAIRSLPEVADARGVAGPSPGGLLPTLGERQPSAPGQPAGGFRGEASRDRGFSPGPAVVEELWNPDPEPNEFSILPAAENAAPADVLSAQAPPAPGRVPNEERPARDEGPAMEQRMSKRACLQNAGRMPATRKGETPSPRRVPRGRCRKPLPQPSGDPRPRSPRTSRLPRPKPGRGEAAFPRDCPAEQSNPQHRW